MKQSKTTIHDIARGLQLNASTVSRALRGHPTVSEKTRERVLRRARELNYQPNRIAAALRQGSSKILGVVVPVMDRAFFSGIIRGIEESANLEGYRVIVAQTQDDSNKEREVLNTLAELQVDGILACIAKDNDFRAEAYDQLIQQGIALQFFDTSPTAYPAGAVVNDDHLGAYLATNHLIEGGSKRIVHLRGKQYLHTYRDRANGYRDALSTAGLEAGPELEIDVISSVEDGQRAFGVFQQLTPRPDAVFSSSDFAALGFIKAAQSAGVRIPEDVAIVGYANEPFTEYVTPALSTVDQRVRLTGEQAAQRILKDIKSDRESSRDRLVIPPQLIIRSSSLRTSSKQA